MKQQAAQSVKQVSLFILPEYKDSFSISVNDTLHFTTYQVDNAKHGPQELIAKLDRPKNNMNISLRIANQDTSFVMNLKKVDSLIFGLDMNRHFIVFNQNEYIWYYD